MRKGWLLSAAFLLGLFLSSSALAEELAPLPAPVTIEEWSALGPLPVGVREAGVDPTARFGDPLTLPRALGRCVPSYLVEGNEVCWRKVRADEKGWVTVEPVGINEDLLMDEWGLAGVIFTNLARATFTVEGGPYRALVWADRVGSFKLNGRVYYGSIYGYHRAPVPVVLRPGENRIELATRGDGRFRIEILPPEDDLFISSGDFTLPDLVRGKRLPTLVGVTLVNATNRWITPRLYLKPNELYEEEVSHPEVSLAPLSIMKLPVKLTPKLESFPADYPEEVVELTLVVEGEGLSSKTSFSLRVRDPDQAYKVTFKSQIDGSVQYYGIRYPKGFDANRKYALIISLHGAGVEGIGMAQAHQPLDWAFVVSPTNRRPFGFDWQDWGRLDLLEVLDRVTLTLPVDQERIYLMGHSMGGHGTWINGFLYPDRFAAIGPEAGWTTFDLYVPMFMRRNLILGDPDLNRLWRLALREENTVLLARNATNLPVFAVVGSADDNVPPQQPRMLVSMLRLLGNDQVEFHELPGQPHWWGDPKVPGRTPPNYTPLLEFLQERRLNPYPRKVSFFSHNYSVNDRAYWVKVLRPFKVYEDIVVEAEAVSRSRIEVKTRNVEYLELVLSEKLVDPGKVQIVIDGVELEVEFEGGEYPVDFQRAETWGLSCGCEEISPLKAGLTYGPMKQVYMKPFLLVYGTAGSPEQTEQNLHLARLTAQRWWYQANGFAQIVADREVGEEEELNYNLVLIGGPESNLVTARLMDRLPIQVVGREVRLAGRRIVREEPVAVKFVYPHPKHHQNLVMVMAATDPAAYSLLPSLGVIYSASGMPDFIVVGRELRTLGYAGARAFGFFNLRWEYAPELTYLNPE